MRSYGEEHKDSSNKKEIEDGSSKKDSRSKTAFGSKDLCDSKSIKENKESAKTDDKTSPLLCHKK